MKRILPFLALAFAALTSQGLGAAEPLKIDPTDCVIVAPAKRDAIVDYAVQELKFHVKLVTGAALPVVTGAPPAGKFPLYVGVVPADDAKPLGTDEARYEITPAGVWLYGHDVIKGKHRSGSSEEVALAHDNEAGTLFAVYDFLEQNLGVRWVEPGDAGIAYEPKTTLVLAPGCSDWVPQLQQRHMRTAYKQTLRERALKDGNVPADMTFTDREFAQRQHDEIVWQRRMRMGGDVGFSYGHAFRQWWAKYGKTHPEWFALGKNGKRGPVNDKSADRVKMCVSNEELVKQVVKDHFAAHKGLVVNACENDSRNFCRCPQCMALDVLLPGEENLDVEDRVLTDRYVHFTNAVLREAKKYDPRAKTVFYAYSRYNMPPRRERLDDDVIVFLLPNLAMTSQELAAYYEGWKKANAKEVFMRPNDLCQDTGLPLGFEQAIFNKFKMADEALRIRGTDYDTCWGFWPVSGIANYIMARAFYRPERSFEDWNNEYCATFGAAKDDVAAYYAYWRQVWNRRVMGNLDRINTMAPLKLLRNKLANLADLMYDESDFDRTDAFLQSALKRNVTAGERRRLETMVLANRHSRLTFRATAANRAGSAVSDAQKKATTQALYDFRRAHRLDLNIHWELLFWLENAYEDNAGFERLLGTESASRRQERLAADEKLTQGRGPNPQPLR
jgi:tetratricopeptide (TPR) repeat protein